MKIQPGVEPILDHMSILKFASQSLAGQHGILRFLFSLEQFNYPTFWVSEFTGPELEDWPWTTGVEHWSLQLLLHVAKFLMFQPGKIGTEILNTVVSTGCLDVLWVKHKECLIPTGSSCYTSVEIRQLL